MCPFKLTDRSMRTILFDCGGRKGKLNTSLADYEITKDKLKLEIITAPLNSYVIVMLHNNIIVQ